MEELKNRIMAFYEQAVHEHFAERIIAFYEQKKKTFAWLFPEQDRIELPLSEPEAVAYFYRYNHDFLNLCQWTQTFLEQQAVHLSADDLRLAVYHNRICYRKNTYKFSKFFTRFVPPIPEHPVDFAKFYDALKTARCYLSIHPLDFLSASEDACFSSCYARGSCHHTGTAAYLRDRHTIIAYTSVDGHKIGRQWIYFDGYYIIMGRIYGAISAAVEQQLRLRLEEEYARHLKVANSWVISPERRLEEDCVSNCGHEKNCHSDYAVYFDLQTEAIIRHREKTSGFGNIDLEFEDGLDSRGEDTCHGHLHCDHCACCREPMIEEDGTWVSDELLCPSCLSEYYVWCEGCESYHHVDESAFYIEDRQCYICESCYENGNFAECARTATYWTADELVRVVLADGNEIQVSPDYAAKNYSRCGHCEEYHEELIEEEGNMYCRKCHEELFQNKLNSDAA